jgi:hypothetical protein
VGLKEDAAIIGFVIAGRKMASRSSPLDVFLVGTKNPHRQGKSCTHN